MSAVTVRVLDDAWAALQVERADPSSWSAFVSYNELRGKAPWLVRVGHDLRRWHTSAPGAPTVRDLNDALRMVVRAQTLGLGGLGARLETYYADRPGFVAREAVIAAARAVRDEIEARQINETWVARPAPMED